MYPKALMALDVWIVNQAWNVLQELSLFICPLSVVGVNCLPEHDESQMKQLQIE
jgi:hypothetical protein